MPTSQSKPHPLLAVGTHLHTACLASSLILHFPTLVSSPSSTLLNTLPILALLQIGYLLLVHAPPSTPKKRRKPATTISSSVTPLLLSLAFSLTVGALILYLLLVLFGAPVTTHFSETALTGAHMALLACFPLVFQLGVDGVKWREVVACQATVDEAFLGAVGACVGAWAGAVPIPLGRVSAMWRG
jgi:phosphatidylinositol glycan class F